MSLGMRALASMALAGGLVAWGFALAQGPNMNLPVFGITPGTISAYAPHFETFSPPARVRFEGDDDAPRVEKPKHKASSGIAAFGYGKPVCVRLCDGAFFPTASTSGGEAACAAQCPDAPTALYTMPGDRIEDAVSETGAPYSKLPVAKRYQTTFDNTCSCHRDSVAANATRQIMVDTTLRKGDIVMTPNGFRVYEGGGYGPSSARDFVAVAQAGLPASERASLASMERASAGSPRIAGPTRVVARPRGHVTVENGDPAPLR